MCNLLEDQSIRGESGHITLDTDDGSLDEVYAEFDVTTETYELEPFSWGQSRGSKTGVGACEIIFAKIGNMCFSRSELLEMVGLDMATAETRLADQEQIYSDSFQENLEAA